MPDLVLSNLTLLFAIGAILLFITIMQVFLAFQHEKAIANAGPIAEREALQAQIDTLQDTVNDRKSELEDFTKKLGEQAEKYAQMEYLENRIEELNTEWNTLDKKRKELNEFIQETEKYQIDREKVEKELNKAEKQLNDIKDQLIEEAELNKKVDELNHELETLEVDLKKLREEASNLKLLKSEEKELREKVNQLQKDLSEIEGSLNSKKSDFESTSIQVEDMKKQYSDSQVELTKILSELEGNNIELNRQKNEKERINAEVEVLKAKAAEARGQLGKGGEGEGDNLSELKQSPPVIVDLIEWPEEENIIQEKDALKNVKKHFKENGLEYPDRLLHAFHTTMKTNETTQLAVLAGISGTGKSQLPRHYAAGMGIGFLPVSVQPRWDSPQDLMGFYNYIEGRYKPTDMAKALWSLDIENNPEAIQDRMLLIMLDEMNLARVEYYFSDFLSRLENRPHRLNIDDKSKRKDSELEIEIPKNKNENTRIFPGYNILFAGTMNEDESTQSLSDKVIDRSNILRFAAPEKLIGSNKHGKPPKIKALNFEQWEKWVRTSDQVDQESIVQNNIEKMSEIMSSFGRPFAHRLGISIKSYVANYPEVEGVDRLNCSLADQIEMRLLPKLRGVEISENVPNFDNLITLVNQLNDPALAKAIEKSQKFSSTNEQFTWLGVTR